MGKAVLAHAVGALVFAAGIAGSFMLARLVDSSLSSVEQHVYIEDSGFLAERSISLFEMTSSTPSLVDALGFINVTNPEDFDTLSHKQAATKGISQVVLLRRVEPSFADAFSTEISEMYNTTIDLGYITDRDIEGDFFVVLFSTPRNDAVLGLIVNSEESRADAIHASLQSVEPTFVDNVQLADTGEIGRLAFYPISSSFGPSINTIVVMVIRYEALFEQFVVQFQSAFPKSEVEVFVSGNKVFDSKPQTELDGDSSMSFTSSVVDILVSEFDRPAYGNVFVYLFVSGVTIVTSLVVVLLLLNSSRVRAERYSSLKSRFIADMSHEIRTPMNGILGMSELLAERKLDSTSSYYVKIISSCGATLMALINDILDMSKIEAGLLEIREDTIKVQQVIKSTVDNHWVAYQMKHRAATDKLEVAVVFETGVPKKIVGDGLRIQQVLSNLLSNSLRFTDAGLIKVVVSCVDERGSKSRAKPTGKRYICVSVQDTGSGMTQDGVKEAFEAFKQVHSRTDVGGTGLGLSICRQLCRLMGGDIVCSSALGVGTTVTFTVEAKATPGPDVAAPPLRSVYTKEPSDVEERKEKSASSGSDALEPILSMEPQEISTHPKILVVDDVLINRKVLSRMLQGVGIDADTCENGLQAVQMCDVCRYSLVLMDMVMPVMDGVKACEQIRSNSLNRYTPVVFVSANVQSDLVARCEKVGGSGFITKPISKDKILEVLACHCSPEEKEHVRRYLNDTGKRSTFSAGEKKQVQEEDEERGNGAAIASKFSNTRHDGGGGSSGGQNGFDEDTLDLQL
eukprot:g10087.t1